MAEDLSSDEWSVLKDAAVWRNRTTGAVLVTGKPEEPHNCALAECNPVCETSASAAHVLVRGELAGREPPPWLSTKLEPGWVWCPACRSDLYVGDMQWWPDPKGFEPGEVVEQAHYCYVTTKPGETCGEEIKVRSTVSETGGWAGSPVNVHPLPGMEAKAPKPQSPEAVQLLAALENEARLREQLERVTAQRDEARQLNEVAASRLRESLEAEQRVKSRIGQALACHGPDDPPLPWERLGVEIEEAGRWSLVGPALRNALREIVDNYDGKDQPIGGLYLTLVFDPEARQYRATLASGEFELAASAPTLELLLLALPLCNDETFEVIVGVDGHLVCTYCEGRDVECDGCHGTRADERDAARGLVPSGMICAPHMLRAIEQISRAPAVDDEVPF